MARLGPRSDPPCPSPQVEAGDRFSCARTTAGDLLCWGGYVADKGREWTTGRRLSRKPPAVVCCTWAQPASASSSAP